ncbi:unnamed protein product [Cylindrotheca closterium]|uniref:DUF6824 domain-containing protein n=1 Tax=Cylindrotheca closterium TaxID=2856 RepID=A0AAD2G190_9STRA|nr:unnamed protein product [Cylindrotheca closterium]
MATAESSGIVHPHDHDVLSGRGNFVNYHAGNEHFRGLVRKHKVDYVQCPKPQKGKFSKMIVDEIKSRNPPGRFLKQDGATKLWYDIGEKKALDKTRQALREGAPDLVKEMTGDEGSEGEDRQVQNQQTVIGNASVAGLASPTFSAGGFQSPVMNMRNHLHISPAALLNAPQLLSPGMMMNGMSPAMQQQMSANSLGMNRGLANNMGHNNMSQVLPPPQVHSASLDQLQHNLTPLQQQQMLLNQQVMNQQALNNGFSALQQFNNTQSELEQAMLVNAKLEHEMQMMQNKLNSIYSNDHQQQLEPTPIQTASYDKPITPQMPAANTVEAASPKLEIPTGQNPRRKAPPSLLVREDSLKMERIFASPASVQKKKADLNGSAGGLSVMSMSIADMQDDGNLSAVFDSSVSLRDHSRKLDNGSSRRGKRSTEFDMSIATLGEAGNMSVNTLSMHESDANVSAFGNVFEDHS